MTRLPATIRTWVALPILLLTAHIAQAAKDDLGNGFLHHGVATPVSNHHGIVCTSMAKGETSCWCGCSITAEDTRCC